MELSLFLHYTQYIGMLVNIWMVQLAACRTGGWETRIRFPCGLDQLYQYVSLGKSLPNYVDARGPQVWISLYRSPAQINTALCQEGYPA